MPIGDFVNLFPAPIFLAVHLTAFVIGAYFAWRSFNADASLLGYGFGLFALAEISYMTYHLDWTGVGVGPPIGPSVNAERENLRTFGGPWLISRRRPTIRTLRERIDQRDAEVGRFRGLHRHFAR